MSHDEKPTDQTSRSADALDDIPVQPGMDAFTRRYLKAIGAVCVVGLIWWLLSLDLTVSELNKMLASDAELAAYPYKFRVLSLDNGVAEMSSPRSSKVAVIQFLRTAFPELRGASLDDPRISEGQATLVEKQSHAAAQVKANEKVNSVRWTLDERWYANRGVIIQP